MSEPLPPNDWEPMTPGMNFSVYGTRREVVAHLEKCIPAGVVFNHALFGKMPDDELLQLAQLNFTPPANIMGEIARCGLNGKFRDLWKAGEFGGAKMIINDSLQPTEAEVRALRDAVYGQPATDKGWDACKSKWMQPDSVQWLREHAEIKL